MRPLPATYCGAQVYPGHPDVELWTILRAIPGHCAYSTVSVETINEAGFTPLDVALLERSAS